MQVQVGLGQQAQVAHSRVRSGRPVSVRGGSERGCTGAAARAVPVDPRERPARVGFPEVTDCERWDTREDIG
ncbi:hypothetical protein GCM10009818_16560 [Nakamurella flavida]